MCQVLNIQRSGLYAWLKQPNSARTMEDNRLLGLIKHSWLESGCVYGYRKVTSDLKDLGERCSKNRVARLMKQETLSAQVGYRRRTGHYHGKPAVVAQNVLQREFNVTEPNRVWVTDITYIKTHEGFLYLAVGLGIHFFQFGLGQFFATGLHDEVADNDTGHQTGYDGEYKGCFHVSS